MSTKRRRSSAAGVKEYPIEIYSLDLDRHYFNAVGVDPSDTSATRRMTCHYCHNTWRRNATRFAEHLWDDHREAVFEELPALRRKYSTESSSGVHPASRTPARTSRTTTPVTGGTSDRAKSAIPVKSFFLPPLSGTLVDSFRRRAAAACISNNAPLSLLFATDFVKAVDSVRPGFLKASEACQIKGYDQLEDSLKTEALSKASTALSMSTGKRHAALHLQRYVDKADEPKHNQVGNQMYKRMVPLCGSVIPPSTRESIQAESDWIWSFVIHECESLLKQYKISIGGLVVNDIDLSNPIVIPCFEVVIEEALRSIILGNSTFSWLGSAYSKLGEIVQTRIDNITFKGSVPPEDDSEPYLRFKYILDEWRSIQEFLMALTDIAIWTKLEPTTQDLQRELSQLFNSPDKQKEIASAVGPLELLRGLRRDVRDLSIFDATKRVRDCFQQLQSEDNISQVGRAAKDAVARCGGILLGGRQWMMRYDPTNVEDSSDWIYENQREVLSEIEAFNGYRKEEGLEEFAVSGAVSTLVEYFRSDGKHSEMSKLRPQMSPLQYWDMYKDTDSFSSYLYKSIITPCSNYIPRELFTSSKDSEIVAERLFAAGVIKWSGEPKTSSKNTTDGAGEDDRKRADCPPDSDPIA
ncbi:hypothetical protein FOZ60_007275 [Perkinsus olseni]|uniref:Uncharacterized protein n=1 Tax=Perkinsus olseni TaxID=32597 RepID=A0A7J6NLR7_PEROL|nr:hypothetical protein FOZ60_007275 [Perkinsus olseni]